jgi:uncharacterized membrane protein YbaN (DUF454 family)
MFKKIEKYFYLGIGFISTSLGIIGLFLPLMPTTCFLIVAVWAFSKSCPALGQKILQNPQVGPVIENWMENKSINRKEKCKISFSIVLGFSITILVTKPTLVLSAFLLSGMLMLLFYINTRAEKDVDNNKTITNMENQKIVF